MKFKPFMVVLRLESISVSITFKDARSDTHGYDSINGIECISINNKLEMSSTHTISVTKFVLLT